MPAAMPAATPPAMTPDLVIRGGTLALSHGPARADLAIAGGAIQAIGVGLPPAKREIDATGKLVLPGGIDAHCHIEQLSAAGIMNADTWETATRSALLGGTTSVIAFAAQHVGMGLDRVVEDYSALARAGAMTDYAFHLIVADPTEAALHEHLPALIRAGHSSIKVFMTYDRLRLGDEALLDVLSVAREGGALVCAHAENHGMIAWASRRLVAAGKRAPRFHAESHPRAAEAEAIERLVRLAALVDQPIMVFHVSTTEGAAIIRRARGEGLKVYAETCPQYLFLKESDLDRPGIEGAKWMCSPPPRTGADQEALWRAIHLGDIEVLSSDHAPYAHDATGKLRAGPDPSFKEIANGLPGLQWRMPLLFDAMVSRGRGGLRAFVEATAGAPARIYNLAAKGALAPGLDADIAIWDPEARVTLSDALVADRTGYTPYAGREVRGWPSLVLRRGEIVAEAGEVRAAPGSGRHLPRPGGPAAAPAGA